MRLMKRKMAISRLSAPAIANPGQCYTSRQLLLLVDDLESLTPSLEPIWLLYSLYRCAIRYMLSSVKLVDFTPDSGMIVLSYGQQHSLGHAGRFGRSRVRETR